MRGICQAEWTELSARPLLAGTWCFWRVLGDGDGHHSSPAGVGQGWWCRYLSSSKSKGLGVSFDSCSQPSRPTLPSPIPSREHAALRWWGS